MFTLVQVFFRLSSVFNLTNKTFSESLITTKVVIITTVHVLLNSNVQTPENPIRFVEVHSESLVLKQNYILVNLHRLMPFLETSVHYKPVELW